jgi:predicted phage replisome organizer
MAEGEIKWIKLSTGIFDNAKIKQIEALPDGDSLIVIWLKLLVLAGEKNDGGAVYFTKTIPYSDQMLSVAFRRPLPTVQLALRTFESFGMIEIINDFIMLPNWEKYQNVEGMDRVREQAKIRMRNYRERKRLADGNPETENDENERCYADVTQRYADVTHQNKNKN